MNKLIVCAAFCLVVPPSIAETITNCAKVGIEVNCTSKSREEADTPSSNIKLGSLEWCLVSNSRTKQYSCGYNTKADCQNWVTIDQSIGIHASCIRNDQYTESNNTSGSSELNAGFEAFQNHDFQTAAGIFQRFPDNVDAQVRLGAMYSGGAGVPKDLIRAEYWMRRAAAGGNSVAKEYLDTIQK